MPAPEAIQKLVENFATHIEHYKSSGYNETELRREYLDPFWKALGWDIDNEQGYADAYKDVIHEDAIKKNSRSTSTTPTTWPSTTRWSPWSSGCSTCTSRKQGRATPTL